MFDEGFPCSGQDWGGMYVQGRIEPINKFFGIMCVLYAAWVLDTMDEEIEGLDVF
jgi:hypothetical protein